MSTGSAPHEAAPAVHIRRGSFWLTGGLVDTAAGPLQDGSAFVQWEAPAEATGALPVVLIHGGGGQSTDWLTTPDGRPGWAQLLVGHGYPVYLIDRPGYGRSPYLPQVHGGQLPALNYDGAHALFVPADGQPAARHTAWPWGREAGTREIDAIVASSRAMLRDTESSHRLDQARVADLLEKIGPAILIAHSAGAPAAWLAADARPDLVKAIIAVEPLGPPFKDLGPRGKLSWGPAAAPLTCANLADVPVAVVSAEASGRNRDDTDTVAYLRKAGIDVEHVLLAENGVRGNGHGLIYEANNDAALKVVLGWLENEITQTTAAQRRTAG